MSDWIAQLTEFLSPVRTLVILGVGNELMGDDGAGVRVVKRLKESQIRNLKFQINLFEAGTTPENFTGPIERIKPQAILFIDAADMGRPVGDIAWLSPERMGSLMHGTHTMPLSFLADYIRRISGAKVGALGIQAGRLDMDSKMSPEVAAACREIADVITMIVVSKDDPAAERTET